MRSTLTIGIVSIMLCSGFAFAGEPNPDVPFGGVVFDVDYRYSDDVPRSDYRFFNTNFFDSGPEWRNQYTLNLEGQNRSTISLGILIPISSRITGRLGYNHMESKLSENIKNDSAYSDQVITSYNERTHTVNTYSLGVRFHIGGSNKWSGK